MPFGILYLSAFLYNLEWKDEYTAMGLIGGLSFVLFNQATGVYSNWLGRSLFEGYKKVLQAWVMTWVFLIVLAFLLKDSESFSRVTVTLWALLTPVGLFIYRLIIRLLMAKARAKGWNRKNVVIVGCGDLGKRFTAILLESKMLGYQPMAFYDDKAVNKYEAPFGIPLKGTIDDLLALDLAREGVDEVVIALPLRAEDEIKKILNKLTDTTVTVKFIPDFFSFDLLHSRMTNIGGVPVISIYDTPLNSLTNQAIKRIEDIVLSSIIILLISPVLIALAIGVKISSPGPVLYKQNRVGWNGEIFTIYKFRSMPVDTDKQEIKWGAAKEKTNTKFGAFIRKTSLDELPQFFNTLKGDMSIVGPRPEIVEFVEEFRKQIPRYMQKHLVKAGITGWAQINGWRGDTSIDKRVQYDLYYIDNWSIWLDIKIIFLTIVKGFINKNAY